MSALEILRAIFGGVFLLLVPGFAWSYLFFKKGEINHIERIGISLGLSIAIVCLSLFLMNKVLSFKINLLNCAVLILVLTIPPILLVTLKARYKKLRGFPGNRDGRRV